MASSAYAVRCEPPAHVVPRLTPSQMEHFKAKGYLVLPAALDPALCARARDHLSVGGAGAGAAANAPRRPVDVAQHRGGGEYRRERARMAGRHADQAAGQ